MINYVKNIKNKNDNITNTIFTREKRNHNNSKIILNKRDKILNLRNIIQKKKVNSYIPFDNKNSFINYNNKNADKFIANKLIKSPKQLVQRTYQNSIITDRNNNKILNNYHTNNIQSFNKKNNFIHLNNNIYRSPLSKVYNPKINLKKHINTAEKKSHL